MKKNSILRDTSADAARVQIEALRRLTPEKRSELGGEWSQLVLDTTRNGIRQRHPEFTADQVHRELAKLLLGTELFDQAAKHQSRSIPMTQATFLREIVDALNEQSIPFMVTGSLASSLHGEPRSTRDIDIVIDPAPDQLNRFVQAIHNEFYVDDRAARAALESRGMFNVIDHLGSKADLILRKDRDFSRTEFARREPGTVLGVHTVVASPEDTILSKLEWSALGESEVQYRDSLRIAQICWNSLDREYLREWADRLGIIALWQQLVNDVQSAT